MRYLSRDTLIYRPDGMEAITLCQLDDVMEALVDVTPSVQVQREAIIGSDWMHQAARGNASLQMGCTVMRQFATAAHARAWGLMLMEQMTLHPEGRLLWLSCYHGSRPQLERDYHATVDSVRPIPRTSDYDTDGVHAWIAVEIKLTLTGDIN